jgi:type IV secretory pathway TrbL component
MIKFNIVCACVSLLALGASSPTQAASMCGNRADFIKALNDKYQESGKAIGIAGQVNLVEVFASKSGTWTILFTTPQGKTCIIAAGSSWEDLPPTKNLTAL